MIYLAGIVLFLLLVANRTAVETVRTIPDPLQTTHPMLRIWFATAQRELPFPVKLVSATRSNAQQDIIYEWGRTIQNPQSPPEPGFPLGRPATNARGGQSAHNPRSDGFSYAIDVAPQPATIANYIAMGRHAQNFGMIWGGTFVVGGMPDYPHIEMKNWRNVPPLSGGNANG